MKLEYLLKRLPVALIIWAVGAATCGFGLMGIVGAADKMSISMFSQLTMYLPYLIVIVCTLVTIIACDQSFAALVWSMVFSVVLTMVFLYATSMYEMDPVVSAQLLLNSPEGTVISPAFHDSARVGIRFLVSVMIPLVVTMIFSWAQKKRHPEMNAKKKKKTKAEKRQEK